MGVGGVLDTGLPSMAPTPDRNPFLSISPVLCFVGDDVGQEQLDEDGVDTSNDREVVVEDEAGN